ncbi:natural cytotoxicity triggering receptor 3 [Bombina bombina]|uniref:natural cytotoxicity triggering receptor 3 n=1 Tax=Bombina bombina TaxID=8345 RepID=UPI00235A928F|nr:natural cytotoxicity triggering receptor 3 [Bombina bombina]
MGVVLCRRISPDTGGFQAISESTEKVRPWSQSWSIYVQQVPEVTTTVGSSVTLLCNYTLSDADMTGIGWFTWYRQELNGAEVSDNNPNFKGRVSRASQNDFVGKRSADLQLHRVDSTFTGMYICQVVVQHTEIISGHGSGTFLNVTGHPQGVHSRIQNLIRIGLGVLVLSAIAPVVLCCESKGRRSSESIYEEVEMKK